MTASDDDLNRDFADDDLEDPAGIRRPPKDLNEEDPGDPGISRPPGDLAEDDLEDPAGIRRPPQDLAEEDPGDPGISRPPGW
jgi:hypothetical protein